MRLKSFVAQRKINHAFDVAHRRDILTKQQFICKYCFCPMSQKDATIDHKKAKFNGGKDEKRNYVVCCYDCNQLKGSLTIDEFAFNIRHSKEIEYQMFRFRRNLWYQVHKSCVRIKRSSGLTVQIPSLVRL